MFVRKRIGRCYNCYANVVTFQISNTSVHAKPVSHKCPRHESFEASLVDTGRLKTEVELIKYCSQCSTSVHAKPVSHKCPRHESFEASLVDTGRLKTPKINPAFQNSQ
jgi:Zn finger protein HypA/HybF involved in hydrogenase expression